MKDRKGWHNAEAGEARGTSGVVQWRMNADEAEEIADFLESVSRPGDVARLDAAALRAAVEDARDAP